MTEVTTGIVLFPDKVDALARSDDLLIATDSHVEPEMILCVHTARDTFSVRVTTAERLTNHHKHDWRVGVEGYRLDELRDALTYRVAAARMPEPPELSCTE